MNVNDVDMNGEASGSNPESTERLTKNSSCNDCGKHLSAVGGARPKARHLVSNIPNGISHVTDDEAAKVNNNVLLESCDEVEDKTDPNADVPINTVHNGLNSNCTSSVDQAVSMDSVLRNNVNCHSAVDKCPLTARPCADVECHPSGSYTGYAKHEDLGTLNNRRESESSSDTGNDGEDGLSADECCIYTYKGDQMADLPSSFFRLDVLGAGEPGDGGEGSRNRAEGEDNGARQSGSSSPEMDFLEMDFDPGPSCDQDSGDESDHGELQDEAAAYPSRSENHLPEPVDMECSGNIGSRNDLNALLGSNNNSLENVSSPAHSSLSPEEQNVSVEASCSTAHETPRPVSNSCSSDSAVGNSLLHRANTSTCFPYRDAWGHHCSSGDLCSPCGEGDDQCWSDTLAVWNAGTLKMQAEGLLDMRTYNLHSALYHCIMAKKLVLDKQPSVNEDENAACSDSGNSDDVKSPVERVMIWSEQEACFKQVTQISTSACGATAVINVLLALNISYCLDKLKESVATRLRSESAALPQYLFSRSVAGATHVDIIKGLQQASDGTLYARFFHMFPDRVISLTRWLAYWMKKGAIPIATLNLQNGIRPGNPIPDAWHHQMVFGVGPRGVYLTNPLECVNEAALWPQLCSPSILLVKRSDVLSRWNENTNLLALLAHPDTRWKKMNVLGQVVNVIRESTCSRAETQGRVITQHVAIPASYCSGITLAISREAPAYEELRTAQELPLLQQL